MDKTHYCMDQDQFLNCNVHDIHTVQQEKSFWNYKLACRWHDKAELRLFDTFNSKTAHCNNIYYNFLSLLIVHVKLHARTKTNWKKLHLVLAIKEYSNTEL